jgi:uncharacterized protein (DUF885 family)
MNKMAGLIDFSLRDLRDKFLADLAKTECELREHLVNTMAVAQVRAGSGSASSTDNSTSLQSRIKELEDAATAASIAHQAELKKLRKENVELQGRIKENKDVDDLEARLEAAHRQIRAVTQENLALTQANIDLMNSADLNDKYAQQDKKSYEDLLAKFKALEASYNELKKSAVKLEAKEMTKPEVKAEESKKEVKKVVKPEPEEEEEVEEEQEEEAENGEEEEEGEEPVEFEYKGKTYFLSSDNDVYQEQDGEYVQVGTWNGKKILFQ